MNWLCCANHHRLTLFFNLKRSVLEHKICQWWLFYLSDTMLTPDFIFKSWVCAVMRVTARFWEVAADLCPHWRLRTVVVMVLFQVSSRKMSLSNWDPQTYLLQSACQRYCSEARVKAEDAWFLLQRCRINFSLQRAGSYKRVQYLVGFPKPVRVQLPIKP